MAAEQNELKPLLEQSIERWVNDQLEIVGRDQIEARDITQVSYVRKKALLNFLPLYTTDPLQILRIIQEIDTYQLVGDTTTTDTFIDLLKERINHHSKMVEHREEQLLEAQEIADLGSFEWDLVAKTINATPQLLRILDLDRTGDMEHFMKKVHPADKGKVMNAMENAMSGSGDYECEYRLITRQGIERIIWSRGVVSFNEGTPSMFKGTVMDVTEKHHMVQRSQRTEYLYKQAQALSHIGNWTWDLVHNKVTWSEELYRIYDLPLDTEITRELGASFRHPDDTDKITEIVNASLESLQPFDFYCRIILRNGTTRIVHSIGEVLADDGIPYKVIGTLQDVTERQTLIERLQESEQLYKEAQARTHIGNWAWDMEKDKMEWSDEMYRIFGLEPQSEEATLEKFLSFITPSERENRLLQIKETMATAKASDFYFSALLRDGSHKILHSKTEIVFDEKGKAVKMVGTCQDVTERQNLIERLQQSDLLYKQAQALAHLGNWTWDIATNTVIWTEELYRIFGFEDTTAEVTFDNYLAHVHPDDRDMLLAHLQHSLKTHESYDFYHRIVLDNGTEKFIQSRGEVLLDENGEPYQMVGTGQDVTKQQLVERQLRANREFIQKITNTTPSLIASYNVNTGKYTYINQALHKILGYEVDEATKNGVEFFMGILHPDDIGPLMEKNQKALVEANANPPVDGSEMVVEFKYRMRHKDGGYRWFHTYGTIFDRNNKGLVEHVLNVSVDITDQEEAELSLYQKNIELQQSNASLEEYAYVASHDLKEPLRKISTFSDRLMSSQYNQLSEDGRLYISKIIESSKRMQNMVSDLLSVSVISGNKAFESHSLKVILNDVLQTLEYKIEERGAVVTFDELPVARIVPSQFRQLFQNLLSNSLKFAREGLPPEIQIRHHYLSAMEGEKYGLSKANKFLRIDVQDNGIGFDNQFANKIFTIFQRLHGKTEYEGTGIGLAICKKIAENHGGIITANGTNSQGATFTIIFPV
jgi:PAS domain S-box-containing protein